MVRVQGQDPYERLDGVVKEVAEKYGFTVYTDGWARKTYNVYHTSDNRRKETVAQLESLAVTSGEVVCFSDRAVAFCQEIGERLESDFGVEEATVERRNSPT